MSTPEPPAPPEKPPDASAETPAPRRRHRCSSAPAARSRTRTSRRPCSRWLYLKIGLLLIVIVYAIAFVVENTDQIKIDFVFWTANVPLIWMILLLLAIGLVGGMLLSQLYRHRRRAKLAKQAAKAGDARCDRRRARRS